METLELPVLEQAEEDSSRQAEDIDLAVFRLWRDACRLDHGADENPQAPE